MYGEGVCKQCDNPFKKTGRNHQTCYTCTAKKPHVGETISCRECSATFIRRGRRHIYCDICTKARQHARSYAHMVKTGYIKNPGVGTGHAQGRGKAHHSWKTGIGIYRQHRKDACERCTSKRHLCTHHRDHDRTNNDASNLETLCKRCHQIEHNAGAHFPKGAELSALKKRQAAVAKRDDKGRFIK